MRSIAPRASFVPFASLVALAVASAVVVVACSSDSSTPGGNDGGGSDATSGDASSMQDVATSDASTSNDAGEGGVCTLHGSTISTTCDTCTTSQCCALANTCFDAQSTCAALYACIITCKRTDGGTAPDAASFDGGVQKCQESCVNTYPGLTELSALGSCQADHCSQECR